MEEAASIHAASIGVSVPKLLNQNISWVMYRMKIKVHGMPNLGEEITIDTWPSAIDRFFTFRDFVITNVDQEILVEASSQWVVVNMTSRKMIPIPTFIQELKFVNRENNLDWQFSKLPIQEHFDYCQNFPVRKGDLDQNLHVNNGKYFQWLMEPLPPHLTPSTIKEVDIVFKSESLYGDKIQTLAAAKTEKDYSHCIKKEQDGTILVLAQSTFN